MLCQACSSNQAATRIQTIVDGELKEYLLCDSCAQKMGYGKLFGINPGNLIGSLLRRAEEDCRPTETCPVCGLSFEEIASSGKVGCSHCYVTFCDRLMPVIQRVHGNTVHSGKRPAHFMQSVSEKPPRLEDLQKALHNAVEEQEFERAAELRDRIRELERQVAEHE